MRFLLFALLVILSIHSRAQTFSVGADLGYQGGRVFTRGFTGDLQNFYFGRSAGIRIRYLNSKRHGLSTGIRLVEKGYDRFFPYEQTYNLRYLEIPLHSVITIGKKRPYLNLLAGPYFGYAMQTDYQGQEFVRDPLNEYIFGLSGGINFMFGIGKSDFGISIQYYNSLTNFFNQQELDPINQSIAQGVEGKLIYFFNVSD